MSVRVETSVRTFDVAPALEKTLQRETRRFAFRVWAKARELLNTPAPRGRQARRTHRPPYRRTGLLRRGLLVETEHSRGALTHVIGVQPIGRFRNAGLLEAGGIAQFDSDRDGDTDRVTVSPHPFLAPALQHALRHPSPLRTT